MGITARDCWLIGVRSHKPRAAIQSSSSPLVYVICLLTTRPQGIKSFLPSIIKVYTVDMVKFKTMGEKIDQIPSLQIYHFLKSSSTMIC